MPTRKEIEDQIAALQAEAESMGDEDSDYEVEIWNEKGEGARVPHSQGRHWLSAKFPELFSDPENNSGNSDGGSDSGDSNSKVKGTQNKAAPGTSRSGTATKYFGKRPTAK